MSRTIRRKNGRHTRCWDCETEAEFNVMVEAILDHAANPKGRYKYVHSWYKKWTFGKMHYEDYVAAYTAHYRGDKRSGYYTPPKNWINWYCNRPLRRKTKQQLHHALVNDTWDGVVFQPYVKDAKWWFW